MSYLKWFEDSLAEKLKEQPVGVPVALRVYVELSGDHGHLVPTAGVMAAAAAGWFSAGLPNVYALGGADQGYVSVTATYPGGQTAVIVVESLRGTAGEQPNVRLLLIGNHGTMEFADTPGSDTRTVDLDPPANTEAGALSRAIERSLQSRTPIAGERASG